MEKKLGQYKAASKYFKAAIKNLVRQHGTLNHSAVGICQTNMADVYRKLGEYERAESLYHTALNTLESTLGPDHIEVFHILLGRYFPESYSHSSLRLVIFATRLVFARRRRPSTTMP